MKEIKLTQGQTALVDDEDFEYLNQWKWCTMKKRHTAYAIREGVINGKSKHILMHRLIMKTPDGMLTDHKDHNGLNNQKSNLRFASYAENVRNRRSKTGGSSEYLGVWIMRKKYKDKTYSYIAASITHNKKCIALGCYETEEEAARAYDKAARVIHGDFANLNFPI